MDAKVDLRVLELLASRLCHDLISPIGAVNNGLELLEDEESGMAEDALDLSIKSAKRAADLLQTYRVALGGAGNQPSFRFADARALAASILEGGKIRLDWPDEQNSLPAPLGAAKLVLNLVMVAGDCLPRGGAIAVALGTSGAGEGGGFEARVTASGQGARVAPELLTALDAEADPGELTPKSVQGHFAVRLAQSLGGGLKAPESAPDSVVLRAFLPSS